MKPASLRQLFLLALVVLSSMLFAASVAEAVILLLVTGVCGLTGLWLVWRQARRLQDRNLLRVGDIFLAKLPIVLAILYLGWLPMLNENSDQFGYDPQRYYFNALDLAASGFDSAVIQSFGINYAGIIYYYGAIALVGKNPAIPAIVNTLVTLLGTLALIRGGHHVLPGSRKKWLLGLGMILPEVVWFDALTSRETLVMSLITITTLGIGSYAIRSAGAETPSRMLWMIPAFLMLAIVRTPILVPTGAAALMIYTVVRPTFRRRFTAIFVIGILAVITIVGPTLSENLGASRLSYFALASQAMTVDETRLSVGTWSERSLGRLLVADNGWEAGLFLLPRMMFNLAAPIPQMAYFDLTGFLQGAWPDWQVLLSSISAAIYLLLFPLILAGLAMMGTRKEWVIIHAPLWCVLVAISGGTMFIHERYRIMAALLLWGAIWLGLHAPRPTIRKAGILWSVVLVCGIAFYGIYKLAGV